ncbi:unnamed protein product [Agarophyton chilense]|eukprot:gb/GEZJ01002984.1/.p1 GENE.gb/GEZJ01002984.1/~~gb/GEZJ01002984.1/.p1  ORF type:complete len:296 (-),score=24.81 gb/GEZJ01002984.1/:233-1120(-)
MPSQSACQQNVTRFLAQNHELILLHLGYRLPADLQFLCENLHGVTHVILCGSFHRARKIAKAISSTLAQNFCRTDRYLVLQPLPSVLIAAHGIGTGSIDVLLHEISLALGAAQASDWCFIRIGSCGGLGISPGTLVVTHRPVAGDLNPSLRMFVLGKDVRYPAELDETLSNAILHKGLLMFGKRCIKGDTLCAETFHIAQGRHDGAFVMYARQDKLAFFHKCQEAGVVNMEMESLALAAFSTRMKIPAAVVCVVLVDRLRFETPTDDSKTLSSYEEYCIELVVDFVLSRISASLS